MAAGWSWRTVIQDTLVPVCAMTVLLFGPFEGATIGQVIESVGRDTPIQADAENAADSTLTMGGHIRWRTESWHNFGLTDSQDDTFQLLRAFAHLDWTVSNHLRVLVEGRTAHAWGRTLPGGRRVVDVDETDLGWELDVTLSWILDRHTTIATGISRFIPGAF